MNAELPVRSRVAIVFEGELSTAAAAAAATVTPYACWKGERQTGS
jgi:hypothetical protein